MKITVTQADINKGKRKVSYACPIAIAANRAKGGLSMSGVGPDELWFSDDEGYVLPASAKKFVRVFDFEGKKSVKPFAFSCRKIGPR